MIHEIWNALTNAARNLLWSFKFRDKEGREDYKKRERVHQYVQWADLIIRPVPNVLRWSLQLSIFVALMIPLFNEIASSFGSPQTFEAVLIHAKDMDVSATLSTMKDILFGIASP